jgi:hypothetical protein
LVCYFGGSAWIEKKTGRTYRLPTPSSTPQPC